MPNRKWSDLNNHLKLGRYAEYYAKMEFASYGYEIYSPEIDDHGVDFIVKRPNEDSYYEVQVKSISNSGYVFCKKDKMPLKDSWLLCLLRFVDDELPEVYIIPATTWLEPKPPFVSRDYEKEGQKSKPEWGINVSKKNLPQLSNYSAAVFFNKVR